MTYIFLIVIAPAFLIAIAAPWSFWLTLAGWGAVATVISPFGWGWYRNHRTI